MAGEQGRAQERGRGAASTPPWLSYGLGQRPLAAVQLLTAVLGPGAGRAPRGCCSQAAFCGVQGRLHLDLLPTCPPLGPEAGQTLLQESLRPISGIIDTCTGTPAWAPGPQSLRTPHSSKHTRTAVPDCSSGPVSSRRAPCHSPAGLALTEGLCALVRDDRGQLTFPSSS